MRDQDELPVGLHPEGVARILAQRKDCIRLVVLNACFSQNLAELVREHIDCVVGMHRKVSDDAAILFAETFYPALCDGVSVGEAFEASRATIHARFPTENEVPQLLTRNGIDAHAVSFTGQRVQPPKS